MAGCRALAGTGTKKVEILNLDFPKLIDPRGNKCDHGVLACFRTASPHSYTRSIMLSG